MSSKHSCCKSALLCSSSTGEFFWWGVGGGRGRGGMDRMGMGGLEADGGGEGDN